MQEWAGIVLYDGVCGFCNRSVRWLLARDPEAHLRFAPLQGEMAAKLRGEHPEIPEDLESMIYVEAGEGGSRVYRDSEAMFRSFAQLKIPWRWLALLGALPRALTDFAYRQLVGHRYRLGQVDECPIPTPAERARFLD